MNEKFTSNNIENEDLTQHDDESDYKNLLTRLKDIRSIISALEKTIFG